MTEEKLLTRYILFETDALAVTFTRIGEQLANGSEEAIRKHFGDPPGDREGLVVAVSENSFKLRPVRAQVKTTISEPLPLGKLEPLPGNDQSLIAGEEQSSEKQGTLVS
jgi:hypothetical protein